MLNLILFLSLLISIPDKQLIASVEKEFYHNLKQIDKEQHKTLEAQFKNIFQRQHSSPYQLYKEFAFIEQKSEQEAKQQAVATGYKEREYTRFIGDIRSNHVSKLMNRYHMSIDLRNAFKNNYCYCYSGKTASYCSGGGCILDSSL